MKTLAWKTLCCKQWLYLWLKTSFSTLAVLQASGFGAVGRPPFLLGFLFRKHNNHSFLCLVSDGFYVT